MQKIIGNKMGQVKVKFSSFIDRVRANARPTSRNKQRGFTMTELGVVLAVGGAIMAIGLAVVPGQLAKIRANKVVDSLNLVIPKIQSAHQARSSLQGLSSAMVANNWMEKSLVDRSGGTPTITTPWSGGTIDFAAVNANKEGQVTITNVPSVECTNIADGAISNDIYLSATINGASVKTAGTNSQIDFTVAGEQCQSSNENTLVMVFSKG